MSNLGARFAYWARKWGWMPLAGAAFMLSAILMYWGLSAPAAHRLHDMEQHVVTMRVAVSRHQAGWVPESPRAAVQTFYRSLPPEAAIPDLMEKIFDAAYDSDLAAEQGEFKLVREKDAAFSRYQMVLPVQGRYEDIRKFVNRVLQEMPAAALDGIGFSREDVHSPDVDAKVRLTLYLGTKR